MMREMTLCTCVKAYQADYQQKKLSWSVNLDASFISKGYCNRKDASVKLKAHESSKCHSEAVMKILTLPARYW